MLWEVLDTAHRALFSTRALGRTTGGLSEHDAAKRDGTSTGGHIPSLIAVILARMLNLVYWFGIGIQHIKQGA